MKKILLMTTLTLLSFSAFSSAIKIEDLKSINALEVYTTSGERIDINESSKKIIFDETIDALYLENGSLIVDERLKEKITQLKTMLNAKGGGDVLGGGTSGGGR